MEPSRVFHKMIIYVMKYPQSLRSNWCTLSGINDDDEFLNLPLLSTYSLSVLGMMTNNDDDSKDNFIVNLVLWYCLRSTRHIQLQQNTCQQTSSRTALTQDNIPLFQSSHIASSVAIITCTLLMSFKRRAPSSSYRKNMCMCSL